LAPSFHLDLFAFRRPCRLHRPHTVASFSCRLECNAENSFQLRPAGESIARAESGEALYLPFLTAAIISMGVALTLFEFFIAGFIIYPIGQGSFSDGMPLGISGTFNFMIVFQADTTSLCTHSTCLE
jgi:hypothetical protein